MYQKLIIKSIRPLGMFLIFSFAALCVICSIFTRDTFKYQFLQKFIEYTISFENRFYDFRSKALIDPDFRSKDIVLVKIDDYSLQKIGSFPLPRNNYALMLNKLDTFGAKVVAFDVLFPEKSPELKGGISPDSIFAKSIKDFQHDGKRVYLAFYLVPEQEDHLEEAPIEMLNDALQTRTVPDKDIYPSYIGKFTFPIPELVQSEAGFGSITTQEDGDGIFRQYMLISNVDTIYYGSLSFNSFEAFTGEKNTITVSADQTGELKLGDTKLEISASGETKIRYVGSEQQFTNVSLYDVIKARDDDLKMKELLGGKLIFVGSTAVGAHDFRPSPIDPKMPGVYSHMNMTHMLLTKYFFQDNEDSVLYSIYYLILGMIIFIIVQHFGNALFDALSIVIIIASSYYIDRYYLMPKGYELKLFYCYFCFIACYSWNTFIEFYRVNKEKKQIRGTFARYVSPTVVDEMLKDPDNIHVGGTKLDITCLFSDVRDFTSISESMTATELAHSLNLYMGKMTDIVFDTKGTLDKYIGDAIVALWGAPLPIGNHAQHAVEGAIKMMNQLPEINEEFKRLGRPQFFVGIGLNSGECSVGNMGSTRIFSYTALGDNMNLGARLEGLCKYYGTQILISEYTLARLDQTIKTRPIDKVIVKGKTHPVSIFEVIYPLHKMAQDPALLEKYKLAHELFLRKDFGGAKELFGSIEDDKPSKRLKELCTKFVEHPELVIEGFDVTKMTEK